MRVLLQTHDADALIGTLSVKDGNTFAYGAQLNANWYDKSDGVPDVVLRIPRQCVENTKVPRPTGDTKTAVL